MKSPVSPTCRSPSSGSPAGVERQQRAALLAVVRAFGVDEATLGAVQGHRRRRYSRVRLGGGLGAAGEDVGQPLDVRR